MTTQGHSKHGLRGSSHIMPIASQPWSNTTQATNVALRTVFGPPPRLISGPTLRVSCTETTLTSPLAGVASLRWGTSTLPVADTSCYGIAAWSLSFRRGPPSSFRQRQLHTVTLQLTCPSGKNDLRSLSIPLEASFDG